MKAILPPDEADRVKKLHSYEVLDTAPEREFDDITLLASLICGTPISLVSLVDENRQWFKSKIGLSAGETSRDLAFCAHSILQPGLTIVEDASADRRFADNPLVTGDLHIRFYAGAPLITPDGHALGTLCVIDQVPHALEERQKTALEALSRQVVAQLELRRSLARLRQRDQEMRASEERFSSAFNYAPIGIALVAPSGQWLKINHVLSEMLGYTEAELIGFTFQNLTHPDDLEADLESVQQMLAGEVSHYQIEKRYFHKTGRIIWVLLSVSLVWQAGRPLHFISQIQDITERKRAETELAYERDLLRVLLENSPDHIYFKDRESRFIKCSTAQARQFRMQSVDQLVGKTDFDFFSTERARAAFEDEQKIIRTGQPLIGKMEKEIWKTDARETWALTTKMPFRNKAGDIIGTFGISKDITSLKQAEMEFRSLAESMPQIVWKCLPDGRNIYFNQRWVDYTGLSLEESSGHNWVKSFHPDDQDRAAAAWENSVEHGAEYYLECRLRNRAGGYRWFLLRAVPERNTGGGIIWWFGTCTDIDEQKQAEESLRLLNSAIEQSAESILITDTELDLPGPRIVFVNPAFTKLTGYTPAEVLGKTPRLLQGPQTDRAVLKRLRDNLLGGEEFNGQTVNYRKDGTNFQMEWHVAPIRNASGAITHYLSIQRDITERKRLETQLFQSQKMETVGKLAGGIAHEFNSIMTAIIGQSELLLADLPMGSPLRKNSQEISQAAERAAILTRQLLAYGRKQILQPEILQLNSILSDTENVLSHLTGQNVDLRIVPAVGLKTVKVDAGQIEQVIVNIAMNADDAMPNGGKLTLETANVTLDEDYVANFPDLKAGEYVMLAITDTGTGMSAATKARLFEPFFSTKGVGQGTGLGLATCYGIIKQSGGHIAVYSEENLGTTFKIYLPQVEPQTQVQPPRVGSPTLARGCETILLVEDDPALREMAAALLGRLGYAVLTAANGLEALGITQQPGRGHIDLLFTDVVMPHMSGKELADRIRSLHPHTKILFTSAYTEQAIVHQGVLHEGLSLLQKPFTPSALAQKVREILDSPV